MILVRYSLAEWADINGCTAEEIKEDFDGTPVRFYVEDGSAVAGVAYEDGTFGCFGCRLDEDGLTYEQMVFSIECGR